MNSSSVHFFQQVHFHLASPCIIAQRVEQAVHVTRAVKLFSHLR